MIALVIKGRSENLNAKTLINEALMCKMFKCLPSDLAKEDADKLFKFMYIYSLIGEKNPFIMM